MSHTPTPWSVGDNQDVIKSSQGYIVAVLHDGATSYDNHPEDSARIVACVNAREGMEDPELAIKQLRFELDIEQVSSKSKDAEIAALKARVAAYDKLYWEILDKEEYFTEMDRDESDNVRAETFQYVRTRIEKIQKPQQ